MKGTIAALHKVIVKGFLRKYEKGVHKPTPGDKIDKVGFSFVYEFSTLFTNSCRF